MTSGVRRKVDDLGRVVIPASIRRTLGIREGDQIEVTVEGERVVLSKPRDACVFCGREEEDLQSFRGRLLCRPCLATLGVLDERVRATESAEALDTSARPDVAPDPTALTPSASSARDDAAPAPTVAQPPAPAPRPAARPAPRPVTPWERARRGGDLGTGPLDGDALARQQGAEDESPPPRRRPSHDPASTTAW